MNFRLLFLALFILSCSGNKNEKIQIQGKIFGTYYRVLTYGETSKVESLREEIDQYLSHLNMIYSTYDPNSELSKLNKYREENSIGVSALLYDVIKVSQSIYKQTQGYFDITVGPIVNAWGFGPNGVQKKPTDKEIEKLSAFVGFDKLKVLKNQEVLKTNSNIYIDLSAIAKGYAVDMLALYLQEKGYKNLLVEIGGEIRTIGKKLNGSGFKVGIEKPELNQTGKIVSIVELSDMSMATSGSYRNFKKYQDKVFSHTIDPITKKPALNNVISVTVIHEECALADAYATAFMAMGAKKSLEFANNNKLGIYILMKNGEKVDILQSNYFPENMKKLK